MTSSKSYLGRMSIYLREMFPLPVYVSAAAVIAVATAGFTHTVAGVPASILSPRTGLGVAGVFLVLLTLRLMDELKDREIDGALFSHRPLPSGRVLESDIVRSLAGCMALFLGLNALSPRSLWIAAALLGFMLLMFRWFFIPGLLRRNLLLNLATHQPVVPLMLGYLVVLYAAEPHAAGADAARVGAAGWVTAMYVLQVWTALFTWEIARKIRSPQEETAYVTYSQILGPAGAVAFAGSAQAVATALGVYLWWRLQLSWIFLAVISIGFAQAVWCHVRFLRAPTPSTSVGLRLASERFSFAVLVAHIVEHLFVR